MGGGKYEIKKLPLFLHTYYALYLVMPEMINIEDDQLPTNKIADGFQIILSSWLEATTNFYLTYQQLVRCTNQLSAEQVYVGQCPVGMLISASTLMQVELEKLVLDINQDDVRSIQHSDELLKKHTKMLNQLTNQAQLLLHLALLRTS